MGGPGSGGYKNSPGDTETHAAWEIVQQDPGSTQKLAQVRCRYCAHSMAQHTSRQRAHLLTCKPYLEHMKEQGIETTITRQADDPAGFFKASKTLQAFNEVKAPKVLKMHQLTTAVRIQALALAEAYVSLERIQEVTGMDPKTVVGLRRLARERGYDPNVSMLLKEEYVFDPPNIDRPRGRPSTKKRPRDSEDGDVDPELRAQASPAQRAPPGFQNEDQLPPVPADVQLRQHNHTPNRPQYPPKYVQRNLQQNAQHQPQTHQQNNHRSHAHRQSNGSNDNNFFAQLQALATASEYDMDRHV